MPPHAIYDTDALVFSVLTQDAKGIIGRPFTLAHYTKFFDVALYMRVFWNTLRVSLVTSAVAIMLALMSLASWSVIFVKAWSLVQLRRMSGGAKQFWHATSFEAGMAALAPAADNPFRNLAERGTEAVSHHSNHRDELHGVLGLNDWLTSTLRQSIDDTTGRLQSGLSILASVGSTAPFIGLFGTVWGIMRAFNEIGAQKKAGIEVVGPGIAEALVTTAAGIAVGIGAVAVYNYFMSRLSRTATELKLMAEEFVELLREQRPGEAPPATPPAKDAATTKPAQGEG